jgi:fructan beta-fructosidase
LVELFADDGLSVMTEIFFPTTPYNKMEIQSEETPVIKKLAYMNLKSMWE